MLSNPDVYATDTAIEWSVPTWEALDAHRDGVANRIATRLAGLDAGSHLLTVTSGTGGVVEFVVWVDLSQAYGDDGQPVPDWQVSTFDLHRVTGSNALLDSEPVANLTSSPFHARNDGNYRPHTYAAERVAAAIVATTIRKAVA